MEIETDSKGMPVREFRDLGTREGFIGAIRDCGRYIIDNAENLLGEYPGAALSEMDIVASFRFDEYVPTVTVKRMHLAIPRADDWEGQR